MDLNDPQLAKKLSPRTARTVLGDVEYVDFGSGPVVVAVHGAMGGCDQSLFLAQAAGSNGYRYLAISRPGFLGTPFDVGRTAAEQGNVIAALLDALSIDQVVVMAVSGGGPSAIEFGLRYPQRCLGLVLIATCGTKLTAPIPIRAKIMLRLGRWGWFVRRMQRQAAKNIKRVAARSIRDPLVLARTINDSDTWPLFSTMLLGTLDRMHERLAGTRNDIEISRTATYRLEQLEMPVLAIHGTADRVVSHEIHAREFAARVRKIEPVTIEGGEHVALFTHRELVRVRVAAFLNRCVGA